MFLRNNMKVSFRGRACRIFHSVPLLGCVLSETLKWKSFLSLAGWTWGLFGATLGLGVGVLMTPRAQSNRGQLQISEHVQAVKLDSLFGQVMHAMSEVEGNLISGRENARRWGKFGNILIRSLNSGGSVFESRLCSVWTWASYLISLCSAFSSVKGTIDHRLFHKILVKIKTMLINYSSVWHIVNTHNMPWV